MERHRKQLTKWYISIQECQYFILNVSGLNATVKRQRLSGWILKCEIDMLSKRSHFKYKDHTFKVKNGTWHTIRTRDRKEEYYVNLTGDIIGDRGTTDT